MDYFSYCSCGRNTPKDVYERDLVSGSAVCKACAKHDKALEKYGDTVDVLQYRYPEDREFVSDMLAARPVNLQERFVKEFATAYYTGHNLIMNDDPDVFEYSLKRSFASGFKTPLKRRLAKRTASKAWLYKPYQRVVKPVRRAGYNRPYQRKSARRYRSKRRTTTKKRRVRR